MVAWVVIFSFHPRRPTHCRHVTKIPSLQLLLFPPLTNRDARNSFRFRSYAKCRVSLAFSFRRSGLPDVPVCARFNPYKSFSCNTYRPPRKCCKQKTYGFAKSFRCNTYKKQGDVPAPVPLMRPLLACVFSSCSPVYQLE